MTLWGDLRSPGGSSALNLLSASVLIAIVERATALSSSMFDAGGRRSRWDLIDAQIASALSRYSLSDMPLEPQPATATATASARPRRLIRRRPCRDAAGSTGRGCRNGR